MKTAVEWLKYELDTELELYNSQWDKINKILEQAKEMEKQQIINAWNDVKICDSGYKDAQQYYNETFKNK